MTKIQLKSKELDVKKKRLEVELVSRYSYLAIIIGTILITAVAVMMYIIRNTI